MVVPTKARAALENGDHLTRAEFHRRYSERPDIKKAELVEGVVYVASPTRFRAHGKQHGAVVGWLYAYTAVSPGVQLGDNCTVFLDGGNEVQPDAVLWRDGDSSIHLTDEDYLEGAPRLVIEVSASSASYDLHEKKEAYRRNGVPEYVVWRVLDQAVDWFELGDGDYVRREPDADGIIESIQFAGLRLHVQSLLAGDAAGVLAAVRPSA